MKKKIIFTVMLVLSVVTLLPVVYMVLNSFCDPVEVARRYGETFAGFLPERFSLMAYYQILFSEPGYLWKFWRSLGMCTLIAVGQVIVGCMGGAAFAKYQFAGRKIWFGLMALFMLLPIQVTLLPNYIILDKLHFLNSYKALIIPGIFAPFGVVWMTLVFRTAPTEWIEAASLDGAGRLRTLFSVLMPAAKPGVISLFVLSFVDHWNMVEQPMVFLSDTREYPLSVFLASMTGSNLSLQFVCGILSLIPVTLLFLFCTDELIEGIGDLMWR